MHKLLEKQLARAREDGRIDLDKLLPLISDGYDEADQHIRRSDRSIGLMVEEVEQLNCNLEQLVAQLQVQNARFETAIDNMTVGLSMFDVHRNLIISNRRYRKLFNLPGSLVQSGTPVDTILEHLQSSNPGEHQDNFEQIPTAVASLAATRQSSLFLKIADGRIINSQFRIMPDGGWVGIHQDVTKQRTAEQREHTLARRDPLTALPNRLALHETIDGYLATLADDEKLYTLCMDLDRFKAVNDSVGHAIGDKLLVELAQRMMEVVGNQGLVARLGGDEFAVILRSSEPPESIMHIANQLVEVVSKPVQLAPHVFNVGLSIGISFGPDHGTDADTLLRTADISMYKSKSGRAGVPVQFCLKLDEEVQRQQWMETDLRTSLALNSLEVHLQPQYNVASLDICGFEALLRWQHPTQGLISPAEFIPLAENTGQIIHIGSWVLHEACSIAQRVGGSYRMAVNISPVQLRHGDFVDTVKSALDKSGLQPDRLELEITEQTFIADPDLVGAQLRELKRMGIHIALDDFGTGFSSLRYLTLFPFDKIKLDKSFVKNLATDDSALAIVTAVASMARSLSLASLAEGVEDASQLLKLSELGFDQVQGFLLSKPKPLSEIESMLDIGENAAERSAA